MGDRRGDAGKAKFYKIIDDKWEWEETLKKCYRASLKMTRQKLLEKYSKTIVKEMEEMYSKEIEERRKKNDLDREVPTT